MKNVKGLKGLILFVFCLWCVVLGTYATQDRTGGEKAKLIPLTSTTCSSSSSSSGGPVE